MPSRLSQVLLVYGISGRRNAPARSAVQTSLTAAKLRPRGCVTGNLPLLSSEQCTNRTEKEQKTAGSFWKSGEKQQLNKRAGWRRLLIAFKTDY